MEVYRLEDQLYSGFDIQREIREEKIVRQLKDVLFTCEKRCFDFTKSAVGQSEKNCMNNCSSIMLKDLIPLTKQVYFKEQPVAAAAGQVSPPLKK